MANKRIVFCADGTWNGPPAQTNVSALDDGDDHGDPQGSAATNVVKIFSNVAGSVTPETLRLSNEQEKVAADPGGRPVQVAKYIHGVGDSKNPLLKLLGGAFGVGVVNRIVRGYTYISRNYVRGDEIHIVGFSRGAYTARALGGLIAAVGLLDRTQYDPDDKTNAYRLGIAAWCKAKRTTIAAGGAAGNALLTLLENVVAAQLRPNALIPNVPIKSIAVWDTVGSLGVPKYTDEGRLDILRFTDTDLSPSVEWGFHAMAIDELRIDFPVTRWSSRNNVEQVWFVGAHGDVGGGYAQSASYLSDIALSWLMNRLASVGVTFATPLAYTPGPRVLGGPFHTPWSNPPFSLMHQTARRVEKTDVLHGTVGDRWNDDSSSYRPQSMEAFGGTLTGAVFDRRLFE